MIDPTVLLATGFGLAALAAALPAGGALRPLALHPENPRIFLFRGKPTILVTSAEHYGAVLNRDFDYATYMAALQQDGLNLTRTFSGAYVEPEDAFGIAGNTLAPAPGRLITPWARSTVPGYANGGTKFDLARWDDEYFGRLRGFVSAASRAGVVVEMNLFCPFYEDPQWNLSPMNAANNVNGVGEVARTDVYTLDRNGGLLAVHEAMARRIVAELREFDNVYYEICNEPYFGGVTLEWQHRIAETIVDAERDLPHRHLISRNVANGSEMVTDLHPAISILNFHYATPPQAVAENSGLAKPIGDNETGFRGTGDRHYRTEGWEFILAGGALYNNLDYSFAVGHEDGTFAYPPSQPGGGSATLRRQLGILAGLMKGLDLVRLRPTVAIVRGGVPDEQRIQVLADPGRAYLVYLTGGRQAELILDLPPGTYQAEWISPISGQVEASDVLAHRGGAVAVPSPVFAEDIALRISARGAAPAPDGPGARHPD